MKLKAWLVTTLVVAMLAVAIPALATHYETPSLHMDNVTFDSCDSSSFTLSYDVHNDYTGAEGTLTASSYWYINGVLAVAEFENSLLDAPGAYFSKTFVFDGYGPEVSTYSFTQLWVTYLDGAKVFESRVNGTCLGGDGWAPGTFKVTHTAFDGVQESVPGCNALIPIPDTAVVGAFTADAQAYWKPGELTAPVVVLEAGKTAWVLGVDASGAYYKVIWNCQYLWVPVNTLGPNYDEVWNGTPLPTTVVS